MDYLSKLFIAFFLMSSIISCNNDDDCDETLPVVIRLEKENNEWRAADDAYNESMTTENCEALNAAAEVYIAALKAEGNCISDKEMEDYVNHLSFMEATIIDDCN